MDKFETKLETPIVNLQIAPGIWSSLLKEKQVIKYSNCQNIHTAVVMVGIQAVTYQLHYFSKFYQLSIEVPINPPKSSCVDIDILCFIANYINCQDIQCISFILDGQLFIKYCLVLDYDTKYDDISVQLLQLSAQLSEIANKVSNEGDSQIIQKLDQAVKIFKPLLEA